MHLHYQQMADGVPVRIRFNGELIDTHAGNLDSYGTYGTDDAEKLTSLNCPGNSFVPFVQNGMRYQLVYKPSVGPDEDRAPGLRRRGRDHHRGGDVVAALHQPRPVHARRRPAAHVRLPGLDGPRPLQPLRLPGLGHDEPRVGNWWAGWTHFMPFSIGGQPYFIAYDSLHGYANIDRINGDGDGSTNIYSSTWTKGWTSFTPFVLGGVQYVLLYKGGSGEVEIDRITVSGNNVTYHRDVVGRPGRRAGRASCR